jgi:hypothetical protein
MDIPAKHPKDWPDVPDFEERAAKVSELKLDKLLIHFRPYHEFPQLASLIDKIKNTQTSIVDARDHRLNYSAFYPNFIHANFRTLTHLAFSLWIFDELDCTVFQQCTSLVCLDMRARPKTSERFETVNYRNSPAKSELKNIDKLPKSLTYILLHGFFLETADTAIFVSEFPVLGGLWLFDVGEKENLGMTLQTFSLLADRGVRVGVQRGINMNSLQDALRSGDGALSFSILGLINGEEDQTKIKYIGTSYNEEPMQLLKDPPRFWSEEVFNVEDLEFV